MEAGATPEESSGATEGPPKKRRHKSGAQKRKLKKMPPGLVDRVDSDLEAMQWVATHKTDETVQQWLLRQVLLRNPERFMDRKAALEKTSLPTSSPAGTDALSSSMATDPAAPSTSLPIGLEVRPGETDLEAMRWVLSHPTDETFLQWQMRQWLLADRDKFMGAKVTLERAMGPTSSTDSSPGLVGSDTPRIAPGLPPDLGTERCLELARGLLEKYGVPR